MPRFAMRWAGYCAGALRTRGCCGPFGNMRRKRRMVQSRRDFLKNSGALVIGFSGFGGFGGLARVGGFAEFGATSSLSSGAGAQGPFATHPSHIDPAQLDSWL